MRLNKKQIATLVILGLLILVSFSNLFYPSAIDFEEKAAKEIAESILILQEIETLSIPLAESIPFLKSWASTYQRDFDKLLSYLNFSYLLLLLQYTLLKFSQWWVFKAILAVLFVGMLIPPLRSLSFKLLVLGLIISPGLSVYTQFMSGAAHQMNLDLGSDLKTYLSVTKDSINTKKNTHQAKLDTLESRQKSRHGGKLNFLDKAEDEIVKTTYHVEEEVEKLGRELLDLLRFAGDHALGLTVAMLANILIVFVGLPVLFWYLFSLWLKRLFGYGKASSEINSKLEELKSITNTSSKKNLT